MPGVKVTIDTKALNAPGGPVEQILANRTERVAALARRIAPKRTGALADSISSAVVRTRAGLQGVVRASAPYALYVHEGTGIYGPTGRPIVPRRAKFLVFRGRDGALVFARSVRGTPPNPFLRRALQAVR